jgi:flavin reductase (DIM6/NTAB) family NADH-FMN oxidoreductase RutF
MIRPRRYTFEFAERNPTITISFPEDFRDALSLLGIKSDRDCDKIKEAGRSPVETGVGGAFKEAKLVLAGRKISADGIKEENFIDKALVTDIYPTKDLHNVWRYLLEIEKVWIKAETGQSGTVSFNLRSYGTEKDELTADDLCELNGGLHQSAVRSIFRDPRPGHHHDSSPPDMDGHTCTRDGIKIRLKGLPRSARGIEKLKRIFPDWHPFLIFSPSFTASLL